MVYTERDSNAEQETRGRREVFLVIKKPKVESVGSMFPTAQSLDTHLLGEPLGDFCTDLLRGVFLDKM